MTRTLTTTLLAPCFILLAGSAGASPPIRNASHEVAPVAIANRAATIEPTAQGFINAVQVYPFTDGAIYRVITAPERVTDIALQPGETLVAVVDVSKPLSVAVEIVRPAVSTDEAREVREVREREDG